MADATPEWPAFPGRSHVAGPLVGGLQRCTRCGGILTDYRDCMVEVGSEPLRGWAEGAWVWVLCGASGVADSPPPDFPACEGAARA
jgi:hypothetical protein